MEYTKEEADKAVKFVRHIEEHLLDLMVEYGEPMEVMCKICGKTIDDIGKED